ncbi:MAG: ShlB/FhaC/HecB family hemolysin secretion/activation protein [Burkholderiaceae bacterium]|nr:ShlB/FhaC/HecB family hemolysin secretion/activation protein [Burkholderiaceae bacterium]
MAAAALCALPCVAQTAPPRPADVRPGTLVPRVEELAPRERPVTDVRDLPPRPVPRELEKPQDELTLDVRGYVLSPNAPADLVAALPQLLAPYVGSRRSYEDLVNAAADVTRYLQRESGFYLGFAYLPEQEPRDGIVRIEVLEGRLDRIELQWPASLPVGRDQIEAYLAQLKPGEILHVRDIERVVFLINDLRGVTARFDVLQGSKPGYASLLVTGVAESRWTGKVDGDINGTRFLGKYRLGGLLVGNSLLGRGDALTLNALASTTGGLVFGLVGYTLPLGSDGVKVGSSLSMVRYQLDEREFPLGVNGDATTLNVYGLYPWVRSRNLNLFTVGAFDLKDNVDRQDVGGIAVRRQIKLATAGITGDLRDNLFGGAVSTFDASLAAGNVAYQTGRRDGLDDASQFSKLNLGANRLQNLVDGRLLLYAALRGQLAMDNLDTIEQFRVGGPDGVRAFSPGEGTGDTGFVANLELRILPPEAWLGRWSRETVLSLFVDYGEVRFRKDPSRQPASFVNAARYGGIGLALAWERPGDYALRMSLSSRVIGEPRADRQQSDPLLYAQLSKLF